MKPLLTQFARYLSQYSQYLPKLQAPKSHYLSKYLIKYSAVVALVALFTIGWQSGWLEQWSEARFLPMSPGTAPVLAAQPKPDTLISQSWWQDEVRYRVNITQNQAFNHCLFGDSISSALGNTLGDRSFNFALSGMSSVSLVEEMVRLVNARVQCGQVIIAMGTNDADYSITNEQFINNMKQSIALARQLQAFRIVLLPAFYSTVAASQNIAMAGPIERVEEINALLRQVAASTQVIYTDAGLQALYNGQALRDNLTVDGVHLNAAGRVIYRNALLRLIEAPPF